MKRLIFSVALLTVLPWIVTAQVEKKVEVTKAYEPRVEKAVKLDAVPDMTDTARLRPEIDYTITPLSLQKPLSTRPIRPATVTYWEFNRPQPFYLKIGAGYPLNSVFDFYASTQHPSTGYIVGYLNHEGHYSKIRNEYDIKNNSTRMVNRVGAAAGKYFGHHTLEADLSYENRLYHRYGAYLAPNTWSLSQPGGRIEYGDAQAAIRFGDDFTDLSRTNFELALNGILFMDYPKMKSQTGGTFDGGVKSHETLLGASGRVAHAFGRHRLSFDLGYTRLAGQKMIEKQKQQQIRMGARYGIDGDAVQMELGADYYHDAVDGVRNENYLIPYLHLGFYLGTRALKPFIEVDGGVYANDYRSLTRLNPYVAYGAWKEKSSVDYNGRFGLGGSLWSDAFTYRVYAGLTIHDNRLYWYGSSMNGSFDGLFYADQARQTVTSLNGEIDFRPVSPLHVTLAVHKYFYNDDTKVNSKMHNGAANFEGKAGIRYDGRKFACGVEALMQNGRKWSLYEAVTDGSGNVTETWGSFAAPFGVDVRAFVEWKVSGRLSLFAEGTNLADRRLYEYPWFRNYGIGCTAGAKIVF